MAARLPALLIVAAAALLLPAVSVAGSSHSTKVIVSLKAPAFHGTLKSDRSTCATGRTVKLFREKSGPDQLLGTDQSNAKTKWSILIGKRLTSGSYYAKVAAKGSCKSGKSKVLSIN
jgi:hypothetical protein